MNLSELLQTRPEFSTFSQRELAALEKALCVTRHESGHQFLSEGQRGGMMFLIVEGEVRVTRKSHEQSGYELSRKLGPGDVFGLVSLIDPGKCTATVSAETPVTVASLPRQAFVLLMHNHAPIATHFQQLVTDQLARDLHRPASEMQRLLADGHTGAIRAAAED
ncbi:MAG: cyclic nucleotide-binding domain-containing protein [Gammaproteobacteria bacterium]|jgi:CRP-like cAMP-binding protein|nr:cyclic nucleotide-binding domain-containing protein [Gammaproteobacteria bacterium]